MAAFEPVDVQVAVEPVPPPVVHDVLWFPCAVELFGLTPEVEAVAFAPAPPMLLALDCVVAVLLTCPGAFAEFP